MDFLKNKIMVYFASIAFLFFAVYLLGRIVLFSYG